MSRWRKILIGFVAAVTLTCIACASMLVCLPALFTDGISVNECPDGAPTQTLSVAAWGLRRGQVGSVTVDAIAHYSTGPSDEHRTASVRGLRAELTLVDAAGVATPLKPVKSWNKIGNQLQAGITLPKVDDGDYTLHVSGHTTLGDSALDLPLAIYAPATINVLSDRPLYEPGNTVKLRALALSARDLLPLDKRPGRWIVIDPAGEVVLEEKSPAGDWGVASGSFPLDTGAVTGDWTARWVSGADQGEVHFTVEPFTLPRFRVELVSERPAWYVADQPLMRGQVLYSSGAPVSGADVALSWSVGGGWPPPTSWTSGPDRLPERTKADANGRFILLLPVVPADLQGQATVTVRATATDQTGEQVAAVSSAMLSEDRIAATAVTELSDGLVEGFNNRLYVRATTPWGEALPDTDLLVKRAWDPTDPGTRTRTDEDGVAALQLDPGPAVNIVVPAPPYRAPPDPDPITRNSAEDVLFGESVTLDELTGLDRLDGALGRCAVLTSNNDSQNVEVLARVGADGQVRRASAGDSPLERCMAAAFTGARLVAGNERLLHLGYGVVPPQRPWLSISAQGWPQEPEGLDEALGDASALVRPCLESIGGDSDAGSVEWSVAEGSRVAQGRWLPAPDSDAITGATAACLSRNFGSFKLAGAADQDATGVARLTLSRPADPSRSGTSSDTVIQGYELAVTAMDGDEEIGDTLLRLSPGTVPDLRIRATPMLPKPGDTVAIELLRGPNFDSELPEKIYLSSALHSSIEAKLDPKTRTASFTLPAGAEGWYQLSVLGATTRVFVRPGGDLSVSVRPDKERYAPGEAASLRVHTARGEAGTEAAVGLIGVDSSLGQLVTLPGADALDGLRPTATVSSPAFGLLDGAALSMGRVRGANAAAATMLRISAVPTPADIDNSVNASSEGSFDPNEALVESFYTVLAELHAQTRDWEASAPTGEMMTPATMARLWRQAVSACVEDKRPAKDAWGRPLRLSWLPEDLLAMTDPREVVVDGTRLPEDVDNWSTWVRKERP